MRHNRRGKKSLSFDRLGLLGVVFFIVGALIAAKLFYVQVLRHEHYTAMANGQYDIDVELLQRRGEIFMHDFKSDTLAPLVVNRRLHLLYTVPREVVSAGDVARELAFIILDPENRCRQMLDKDADEAVVLRCEQRKELEDKFVVKLSKHNDPYELLYRKLSDWQMKKIKDLKFPGIYFDDDWTRFYPEGEVAAQVTGFLGFRGDGQIGQYGIEGYFEKELAGLRGELKGDKDLRGHLIPVGENKVVEAQDGLDFVLTLDKIVQNKTYEILKKAIEDYGAQSGSIIVIDPKSGKVRGMVNYPSFNPNNYASVETIEVFKNPAVTDAYEPGSIFKVITMAAGIDSGAVASNDTYVDEGVVEIGRYKIRNADNKTFGKVTMTEILEKSINNGTIYVAMKTGKGVFRKYVHSFNFGQQTGLGLSGESAGDISSLDKHGDIYLATASYGQGITVTPIQMAGAVATIVNDGVLVIPRVIDYVRDNNGNEFSIAKIDQERRVISTDTAEIIKAMMVSVIKNGHGKRAGVPGYYIGGKTGTAEVAYAGKYTNENIHSFVGFGPLDNSRFVIVVKLVNPERGRFSAVTAAPVFSEVAGFLLQYYGVAPEYEVGE